MAPFLAGPNTQKPEDGSTHWSRHTQSDWTAQTAWKQLLIKDLARPNGIAFSPDEKTLYVSNSGPQKWMRYTVNNDGTVGEGKLLFDASGKKGLGEPDGIKVDRRGNIWGSGPGGVSGVVIRLTDSYLDRARKVIIAFVLSRHIFREIRDRNFHRKARPRPEGRSRTETACSVVREYPSRGVRGHSASDSHTAQLRTKAVGA